MIKIFATVAMLATASSAFADNFDANTVKLQFSRDAIVGELNASTERVESAKLGIYVLPHTVAGASADVFLSVGYGFDTEDTTFAAKYGVQKEFSNPVAVYGSVEAASTDGNVLVTPLLGASYDVIGELATFAEVSYELDASNDWASNGGKVEIGVDYSLGGAAYLRPSLTRTFDTGADETNAALTVGLAF